MQGTRCGKWRHNLIVRIARLASIAWSAALLVAAFGAHSAPPIASAAARPPAGNLSSMIGAPPIERFTPNIDIYPQHLCVAQAADGRVLMCSADGLAEFDSERWRLTRMPNGEIVRSLDIATDGTVYLGGYNFFGAMRRDAAGQPVIEDLSAKFRDKIGEREFADIWEVLVAPEGVWFRALHDLFLWNPQTGATAHWQHAGRFGRISTLNGRTILQFRGEGIKVREAAGDSKDKDNGNGNGWVKLSSLDSFTSLLRLWVPLRNGPTGARRQDGGALMIDHMGGWYLVASDGEAMPQPRPRGLDEDVVPFRAIQLPDGNIALGTMGGEVFIIDESLANARRVMRESGFVTGLALQQGGGVLAVLQGDLYRIGWPVRWSVLGERHGVIGNFSSLVDWNGVPHLLTSGGLYRGVSDGGELKFQPLAVKPAVPSHLLPLDQHRALLAESHHMSVLENGRLKVVSDEKVYPREFRRSRFHDGLVFVFTEHGLRTVRPAKNYALSAPLPDKLGVHVTSLVEVSAREAWAGTERHGVLRYRLSENGELQDAEFFGAAQGLALGQVLEAHVNAVGAPDAAGKIPWLVSGKRGEFRWNGKSFEAEPLGDLATLRREGESFAFVPRAHGELWAYSSLRILLRAAGQQKWRVQEIRPLLRGALVHHTELANGQMAFVTSNGLLIHSAASAGTDTASPASIKLTGVTLERDGKQIPLPLLPDQPLKIEQGDFSLRFDFALPELVREGIKRYQGHLEGEDDRMSDWAPGSRYTYSVLKPRDYTMRIRARDSEGRESELPPYRFTVVPPWHGGDVARLLFAFVALSLLTLAVMAFIRWRTARLARDNAQLESRIADRTRELADANRRLEHIAHLDGLTGIANRRSLDEQLPNLWQQCRAQSRPLSVLLIDADHFKQYNDRLGHIAGDDLLRELAKLLNQKLRRTADFLARYGGEEFIVAMPGADAEVAVEIAEAMRRAVAESPLGITISIGVCTVTPNGTSPQTLIETADRALYRAKSEGRNRVCVGEV